MAETEITTRTVEPRSINTVNTVNSLIHLYRGELGRMTAYRARLDTTTNWAITTSALIITFTMASEERAHGALVFLMLMNYFFLHLEARRFSAYEASRRRVRLLERSFFPEMLGAPSDPRWPEQLAEHLRHPAFPTVPLLTAMSWRLRRIYLWIYSGVLMAWLSKLDFTDPIHLDFVSRAAIGSVPGWLVSLCVLLLYLWLAWLTLRPGWVHPLANPYSS